MVTESMSSRTPAPAWTADRPLTAPAAWRATISALRFRSAATRSWSEQWTPRSAPIASQGAAYVFTESGSGLGPEPDRQAHGIRRRGERRFRLLGCRLAATRWWSGRSKVADSDQGAAYVFTESGSGWTADQPSSPRSDGLAADDFGSSVSISGNTIVVGAEGANSNQAVRPMSSRSPAPTWTQTAGLTPTYGAAGDAFGDAVAISGNTVVVGTPQATVGANSEQGAAYVFGTPTTVSGISPASGPATGGTTITIAGAGFTGATLVNFGTTPATNVVIDSEDQITATSPAGTGTVNVTVVKPGITSPISLADEFTYVTTPAVTGISQASGPMAGGTSVTISGTSFTGATQVDFGSAAATYVVINSATQITATSPPAHRGPWT